MIEHPPPATATADTEAAPRTSVAPSPNGHRPPIDVPLSTTADNDTHSCVDLVVQLDRAERRITMRGELDIATVALLTDAMTRLCQSNTGDTTIDIGGLSFIDAAGLGCLVAFANQLVGLGASLSMVGGTARLRRVFDLVQLGGLLATS